MDGVVVVDKPAGMTSHDVVDALRRRLGTRKVGHAGTLDPDATGVLVLGVGRATRLLAYAQAAPKRYAAVARFGVTTTTQDASGDVVERRPARVAAADVERALPRFTGAVEQVPPMVSAVKVGGERLYRKARRGEEVERHARRVVVYELALTSFEPGDAPAATLDVACSAGTYVRTLVHDLGAALGCGAHLERLRRTEASGFTLADAVALDAVTAAELRPASDAVRALPRVEVDAAAARAVRHGRPLPAPPGAGDGPAAIVHDDRLLAVYRRADDRLVADRVVSA
ncbi:MAG TPA: tRNA pseudouridine(55) synthase TruB [Actinomycetota bacterium]|nr:tRNA pseudouridine(55) synthase TruB [Actinomycetota bacterium]